MNPPNRKEELILRWLDKADEDLAAGFHMLDEGSTFPNVAASQAQQAAEKFVKGYLTWLQIDFPKTHNLKTLLDLMEEKDTRIASELKDIGSLTQFIISARYPDDIAEISQAQAQDAIGLAQRTKEIIISALPSEITLKRQKP